jgi:hypothetical protein
MGNLVFLTSPRQWSTTLRVWVGVGKAIVNANKTVPSTRRTYMLTSIQNLNKSLFNFANTTFEEGVEDLIETKNAISDLFHEDTQDFFVDYDLFATENSWG